MCENAVTAWERSVDAAGDEGWSALDAADFLVRLGDDVFVMAPTARGDWRAYVNGHPVLLGLHRVEAGDLVLVAVGATAPISCVVGPARSGRRKPTPGRVCDLTRQPLDGRESVVCGTCARAFVSEVALQLGACPGCRAPLGAGAPVLEPAEELA